MVMHIVFAKYLFQYFALKYVGFNFQQAYF